MEFNLETYLRTMGSALKEILKGIDHMTKMLDVIDIELKQLKENDNILNKKLDKIQTSCEKNTAGVVVNNTVEVDLTDRQIAGKCKYTDEQLYCMHYNIGNKYGKAYSYSDLVKLTGMSSTYIKRQLKNYKNRMGLED